MNLINFQDRYNLRNKDIAEICGCSLPTIQKWRSGQVQVSGAAAQLMEVLDRSARGDPLKLRELIHRRGTAGVLEDAAIEQEPTSALTERRGRPAKGINSQLDLMLDKSRLEKALFESEARYLSLLEAAQDPICRWKKDTTLTYVNAAYQKLFGASEGELIGRRWIELVPPKDRAEVQLLVSELIRSGEPGRTEHNVTNGNGAVCMLKWQDWPIKNERGEVVDFHSIGHDCSTETFTRQELANQTLLAKLLMGSRPSPVAILGRGGKFVQTNAAFVVNFGAKDGMDTLFRMLPGPNGRQLRQLVQRINSNTRIVYHIEIESVMWRMTLWQIHVDEGPECYLVEFEKFDDLRASRCKWEQDGERPAYINARNLAKVEDKLTELGCCLQASRVCLYEIGTGDESVRLAMRWSSAGMTTGQPVFQDASRSDCPWLLKRMNTGGTVKVDHVSTMPAAAQMEQLLLMDRKVVALAGFRIDLGADKMLLVQYEFDSLGRLWHSQEWERLDNLKADILPLLAKKK